MKKIVQIETDHQSYREIMTVQTLEKMATVNCRRQKCDGWWVIW